MERNHSKIIRTFQSTDADGHSFDLDGAYGERCGADMGGELPFERATALELVAGSDDPETNWVWIAAADPSVNNVVLVIQRVLVLVIYLHMNVHASHIHITLPPKFGGNFGF
jgi:hypothetical protein